MTIHLPQYGKSDSYDIVNEIFRVLLVVTTQSKRKGRHYLLGEMLIEIIELEEMLQNIANVFAMSYLMNPDKENPNNLFFLNAIIDNIKYR